MAESSCYEGIVILGSPRSGTTLLRRLLDAHPNIACPGETNVFSACARFLQSETFAEGLDIGVLAGLNFMGVDDDQALERLREFAFSFHRENAARQGKTRWADKSAFDSFHLDGIEQLIGDHAKFVCLQRHGLDVVCSMQDLVDKTGGYVSELQPYITRYPRPLEALARAWVDLTCRIREFAARHPDNALIVKYEDLTASPEVELKRIFEFLEESWDDGLLETALQRRENIGFSDWKTFSRPSIDRSSVGRWKQLSRGTINMLAEICNPILAECGYPEVEVTGDRSPAEARRRYELGMMLQQMRTPDRAAG